MPLPFVDANVMIRYATSDHADHSVRARALIAAINGGEREVTTCEGVLVEVVYTLASRNLYNLPRSQIAAFLSQFLSLRGVRLPHKRSYLAALALYEQDRRLSFVDALLVVHARREGSNHVISFDQRIDRVPDIHREEP